MCQFLYWKLRSKFQMRLLMSRLLWGMRAGDFPGGGGAFSRLNSRALPSDLYGLLNIHNLQLAHTKDQPSIHYMFFNLFSIKELTFSLGSLTAHLCTPQAKTELPVGFIPSNWFKRFNSARFLYVKVPDDEFMSRFNFSPVENTIQECHRHKRQTTINH